MLLKEIDVEGWPEGVRRGNTLICPADQNGASKPEVPPEHLSRGIFSGELDSDYLGIADPLSRTLLIGVHADRHGRGSVPHSPCARLFKNFIPIAQQRRFQRHRKPQDMAYSAQAG